MDTSRNPQHPKLQDSSTCNRSGSPAPRIRIGDGWVFATQVPGSGNVLRLRHEVHGVAANGLVKVKVYNVARPDDAPLAQVLDAEMNRVSREFSPGESVNYAPAFPMFRFPMAPGCSWSLTVRQSQQPEDPSSDVSIAARVLRWESVQVRAGRFEALRIQARHGVDGLFVDSTYWYAPRAGRSVRGEELTVSPRGRSELHYELLEMWRPA